MPIRDQMLTPLNEGSGLGPAMAKLLPQQRAWVEAFIETGPRENATEAARRAGYGANSETEEKRQHTCQITGYRLRHNPDILAAIKEVSENRFGLAAARAVQVQIDIMDDSTAKASDRLKATESVLARAGMQIVNKSEVVRRDIPMDEKAMIRKIAQLARDQGLDPQKLLASRGYVIDAEFEVVSTTALTAPAEPAMSSAGLEDLL
jgi:phage terminase small subunit